MDVDSDNRPFHPLLWKWIFFDNQEKSSNYFTWSGNLFWVVLDYVWFDFEPYVIYSNIQHLKLLCKIEMMLVRFYCHITIDLWFIHIIFLYISMFFKWNILKSYCFLKWLTKVCLRSRTPFVYSLEGNLLQTKMINK